MAGRSGTVVHHRRAAVLGAAAGHPVRHSDEKSRDTRHPAFLKT
jgi:hypothetical protein